MDELKTSAEKLIELILKMPKEETDKLYMFVQGVKIGENAVTDKTA